MAAINELITLGIGTPADISHLTLFGLNTNASASASTGSVSSSFGNFSLTATGTLAIAGVLSKSIGNFQLLAYENRPPGQNPRQSRTRYRYRDTDTTR